MERDHRQIGEAGENLVGDDLIGEDDFLYEDNVRYRELLDNAGYDYIYRESTGGHIWRNWRIYLAEYAQLLFK